jgi:hypothetical protein
MGRMSRMPSEYIFTLSEQDTNMVVGALIKLPYEAVAPLIAELQRQIRQQQKTEDPGA